MIHLTLVASSLGMDHAQSSDLVIASQDDYLLGYQRIVEAIHAKRDLQVLVRDKLVGKWLTVLARRYGPNHVQLSELTLHKQLQKQIGVEIPAHITDQQLLDSGLLELNIPAAPGTAFNTYILDVFFGTFLTTPSGLRRVGEIIASYDPDQWRSALERPLVNSIYQNQVRQLRQELKAAGEIAELQLLEWLHTDPELFIRNLAALKLLAGYPEALGKRVFGKTYPELRKLDLRKVPVSLTGNDTVRDEIRLYLASFRSQDPDGALVELLDQVSGFIEAEFNAVLASINTGHVAVTAEAVRRVREKFRPLAASPRLAQTLADLDLLISRDPPSTPDRLWNESQWIKWAMQEYLPYRFWLESTGQLNDEIGDVAGAYADWLYEHYGQLLYHSNHMAWKSVLNLKETLATHSGPVLVVMVDNLNAKFYPDFQSRMQEQGYFEHSLAYCISMLPSCTEVSKRCVMTGHYIPFADGSYQSPIENIWGERLGRKVKYVPNIGELRAVASREHDVYFLNYLPLDIVMHQSENHTGISHAQAIRAYLESLSRDIRAFASRIGAERDLMVVTLSDHGSTRIPSGTVNVIQGKFYKDRAEDEHHRYISVSDSEMAKLSTNSQYDCYPFDKQKYELNANYLVARRLYRFKPTDESVYIHGGLTPEETLVPVAIYQPVTVTPKPLSITLLSGGKLYVGTKLDLELELTNFNAYPCEAVTIELPDPNIEADSQLVGDIGKLQRVRLGFAARCPRTADPAAKTLHLRVTYRFLGQPCEHPVQIPVSIIEPARAKFDIDDL